MQKPALQNKENKIHVVEWAIISTVLANTHSDMSNQLAQSCFSTEEFMIIYLLVKQRSIPLLCLVCVST